MNATKTTLLIAAAGNIGRTDTDVEGGVMFQRDDVSFDGALTRQRACQTLLQSISRRTVDDSAGIA